MAGSRSAADCYNPGGDVRCIHVYAFDGGYLLVFALLLYRTLEPGSPFFLVSILASILDFYIPGRRGFMMRLKVRLISGGSR